jgi:quinol monooxygenase YgiN
MSMFVEAYKAAILENARVTIREEGVIRFDIFQDKEVPEFHLQIEQYQNWKDKVKGQEVFARKGKGNEFKLLFPEE